MNLFALCESCTAMRSSYLLSRVSAVRPAKAAFGNNETSGGSPDSKQWPSRKRLRWWTPPTAPAPSPALPASKHQTLDICLSPQNKVAQFHFQTPLLWLNTYLATRYYCDHVVILNMITSFFRHDRSRQRWWPLEDPFERGRSSSRRPVTTRPCVSSESWNGLHQL